MPRVYLLRITKVILIFGLATVAGNWQIEIEYPVELPFLLGFIKTKKSNMLLIHRCIPTCAVV